jgi:hypothetical protein
MCLSGTMLLHRSPLSSRSAFMGQVVSFSQHQATKDHQIEEAEREAKKALQKASAAYKELHRLRGD